MNTIFKECDTCATKPGSPALCSGCLHNRAAMENLYAEGKRDGEAYIGKTKREWYTNGHEDGAAKENNRITSILGNLFSMKPSIEVTYEKIMRAISEENVLESNQE